MPNTTTIAAPIAWPPSSYWDGNDGLWNSFVLSAGTPPQSFRVFPSTAGQETWLPDPAGCDLANPNDPGYCGYLRGTLPYNGVNSSGFESNQSSTWVVNGLFSLNPPEESIGYNPTGSYGFDTVALGNGSTAAVLNLTHEVIASIGELDFWTGYFGLGPRAVNFSSFNDPVPCFMQNLVTHNLIPSLSWGYTAGAYYRDKASASLTLGGYDTARFIDTNLTISMNIDNSRPLQVAVDTITAEDTLCGAAVDLSTDQTYHFIDSTVPHIWLPGDVVDRFVGCFGLTYDNTTDLYLVNDTVRSQLLRLNPTLTFNFTDSSTNDNVVTIALPYAALDLQASYPFYQTATNYFPIRRAANDSQYTIGRTLLQEAYLIADFERNNFTIAQASFDNLGTQSLKAITPPSSSSTSTSMPSNSGSSLTGGAIAGIAIGVIAAIALLAGLLFFLIWSRRRRAKYAQDSAKGYAPVSELPHDGRQRAELPSDHALVEITPSERSLASELPTSSAKVEVAGSESAHEMYAPFKR